MVARSEKAVTITIINITNKAGAGGWVRTGQGSAVSRHRRWVLSDADSTFVASTFCYNAREC